MALELPYGYRNLDPEGSSNVDEDYGYYNSISEALINVPLAMRKGGRTVGIKQSDGSIIEYWWENDNDLSDEGLVKKKAEPFDPTQLEADIQNLENTKQDNLGFTPENIANKGGLLNPSNITYPTTQEVSDALGGKVDKEAGKGLSQENYTTAEKDKLAGLESSKWRGLYVSKSALELANPTPEGGDYADVDTGTGSDTIRYVYDETDDEWIESGSGAPLTAEQIKQMYESNTDTNAFTDSLKSWLQGMSAQFTTVLKNSYDNAVSWISTNGQNVLDHINSPHAPADAQVNVKSDWNATSGDAEILNKPTKTSEFLNDGEDGLSPFISVSDIYRGSMLLDYDFVNVPNTYQYDVTVRKYIIDDNYFDYPNADTIRVTLDPSHSTLNRRDVVVINLAGDIYVKTGIPSVTPFAPNIDYNTELIIKDILVTWGTTAPTEVNTLIVYNENLGAPTEFNTSKIGIEIDLEDSSRAQSGTKSVLFREDATESDVAIFTAPTPFLMSDYDYLNFWVYLVEDASMMFNIGVYRSSGTLIRKKEIHKGILSHAGKWILVSIPSTELIPTIITELNEAPVASIRISKVEGHSEVSFDNIFLQGGIVNDISAHNSLSGKQGGNAIRDEYFHVDEPTYNAVVAYAKDLNYPTISAMIAAPAQTDQVKGVVIRVDDAGEDTNITFPQGETRTYAYYQLRSNSTKTGSLSDYTLISAPYANVPDPIDLSTGLEAIDEGNGIGWRLKGANPDNYGDIGLNAIDLGASDSPSTTVGATGSLSTVGGGYQNEASGSRSTVGGGRNNTASGNQSTVGGGAQNTASSYSSTVGGGDQNIASGAESTVGGGRVNKASGSSSTVGGGSIIKASGSFSFVGGGYQNTASGSSSTVGGGSNNEASGSSSTVGGGANNEASGASSTVGGGANNEASGASSTVGGGSNNIAKTFGEFLGGVYSTIKEGNIDIWIATDRIFGIGNGKSESERSDAFNVYKNGVAELPSVTNTLIDAAGAKTIPTKEWVESQKVNADWTSTSGYSEILNKPLQTNFNIFNQNKTNKVTISNKTKSSIVEATTGAKVIPSYGLNDSFIGRVFGTYNNANTATTATFSFVIGNRDVESPVLNIVANPDDMAFSIDYVVNFPVAREANVSGVIRIGSQQFPIDLDFAIITGFNFDIMVTLESGILTTNSSYFHRNYNG